MFKQHNLDKNGKHKDEAEILKILSIITEHLYDNQCRSFNFTSSMAIERVSKLKTGNNLGRYNNFINMVKRYLKIMDKCVLNNLDGDQAEKPTLDITDTNFIKRLRKLCTLSDHYEIIAEAIAT
jgi:hypothetical protein